MLEKLNFIYKKFPDCLVQQINYKSYLSEESKESIEITLSCYNFEKEGKREIINIIFKDLTLIKFIRINNNPSLFLDEIYIKEDEGLITFDFFPIDHFDYLEENPNSEFIIKCKKISYEVLSSDF